MMVDNIYYYLDGTFERIPNTIHAHSICFGDRHYINKRQLVYKTPQIRVLNQLILKNVALKFIFYISLL